MTQTTTSPSQTNHQFGRHFTTFMADGRGRFTRVLLGLTIIAIGPFAVGGAAGYTVAAFGLIPIAAGIFNLCPIAPIWGGHFRGSAYNPSPNTHHEQS